MDGWDALLYAGQSDWPDWRCYRWDDKKGDVCNRRACLMRPPAELHSDIWPVCEEHRTADAVPIPPDMPYRETRINLSVTVYGAALNPGAAEDEAVRRVINTLQGVGAHVTQLAVRQKKPVKRGSSATLGRLMLDEGGERPASGRSALHEAPMRSAELRSRRRRAG